MKSSEATPTPYMWLHLLWDSERFTLSSLNSLKRSAALPSSFVYAADQVGPTVKWHMKESWKEKKLPITWLEPEQFILR